MEYERLRRGVWSINLNIARQSELWTPPNPMIAVK
jgi:hypothetical protein